MLPASLKIAYLSPEFPKVRHGFQAEELVELQCRGHRVTVFSLRRPTAHAWLWLRSGFPELSSDTIEWLGALDAVLGTLWLAITRPSSFILAFQLTAVAFRYDRKGSFKTLVSVVAGFALAWKLRRNRPNWIHADFSSAPATVALIAGSALGIPFSFCARAFDVFSTIPAGRATRALIAEKITHASHVFAENTLARNRLIEIAAEFGYDASVTLKRNGVRVPTAVAEDAVVRYHVVGMGALVPKKGFDTLLRAAHAASEAIPDISVTVYGEGTERARLETLASTLGLAVQLPGAYSRDRLPRIFAEASVVAIPSRTLTDGDSDGVPTVLIEALAAGRPVIGTDVGSVSDLVRNNETGLLIPPDDPAALADALVNYWSHPERAARLAQRGRDLVRAEFTVATTVDVFERAIRLAAPASRQS